MCPSGKRSSDRGDAESDTNTLHRYKQSTDSLVAEKQIQEEKLGTRKSSLTSSQNAVKDGYSNFVSMIMPETHHVNQTCLSAMIVNAQQPYNKTKVLRIVQRCVIVNKLGDRAIEIN